MRLTWPARVTAVVAAAVTMGALAFALHERSTARASAEQLAAGGEAYAAHCASCHGKVLEGQPDWQRRLPSGRLPAPPHDASGHTWHHPDGVLFRITKDGPAAVVGGGYESDMPGFGEALSDEQIRAIIEYIKSTWPERERRHQAKLSAREREAQR